MGTTSSSSSCTAQQTTLAGNGCSLSLLRWHFNILQPATFQGVCSYSIVPAFSKKFWNRNPFCFHCKNKCAIIWWAAHMSGECWQEWIEIQGSSTKQRLSQKWVCTMSWPKQHVENIDLKKCLEMSPLLHMNTAILISLTSKLFSEYCTSLCNSLLCPLFLLLSSSSCVNDWQKKEEGWE